MYIPKRKGHTAMKKNIFEETYNKVQDAKSAYETATTETEQNAARTI